MTVTNSASGFDNWNKMIAFAVIDEQSASLGDGSLVSTQTFNSGSDNAWSFMTVVRSAYLCPALWFCGSILLNLMMLISTMQEYLFTFGYGKRTLHFNNDVLIAQTDIVRFGHMNSSTIGIRNGELMERILSSESLFIMKLWRV